MTEGRTSKLDFLAHHEAGHAAVAFSFGLRLDQVRIEPDDDSGGVTLTDEALQKRTDIQRVLIAMAGTKRYLDPSCVGQRKRSDGDEVWALKTVVARLHSRLEGRSQDYIDKICKRMKSGLADRCALIVEERWPAIQRLAAELASRASVTRWVEITGEEAERVLGGEDP
jgi:Peptidase M50B-like